MKPSQPKRILFVDDDPALARVYALVLQNEKDRWEVRSTTSAKQALEMMKASPFDVVVSDLRMPEMDGAQLVVEIRKQYPRTSRVILSGIRDQEEVARCLGATHQFIPKPVNLETLRDTLTRICGLDQFLTDEKLRALVGQFETLPSFPALYIEVVRELAGADPSISRIAEIVGRDPAMTAKMLHIVNSAAFGLARKISGPFEAIQHLGTGTVRSLVLSVHVFSCFEQKVKGFSIDEFETHALRSAMLARHIVESLGGDPAVGEEAYIAGMLHDVGRLMLASSLPEKYQQSVALAVASQMTLNAAETEIFGATHASVGAYLLGLWGLPATIVEAVAFHHTPGHSDVRTFGPLTAVHIADAVENEELKARRPMPSPGLDAGYLNALKLQDRLEAWRGFARGLSKAKI